MPILSEMHKRALKIICAVIFIPVLPVQGVVEINFPSLSSTHLSGAREYATIYESYAKAFGKYYAPALGFSSHLTAPTGKDQLSAFPSLLLGTGLGTSFANVKAIKAESNEAVTSSAVPSVLPSLGLSFNLGVGITKKWAAYLSLFPSVEFAMPASISGTNASFTYSNVKARTTYLLVESSFLKPGVSLGGYMNWTRGRFKLRYDNISSVNYTYDFNGTPASSNLTYDLESDFSWSIFGTGAEIRAWYDLMFFSPYIGYGLGLQTGRFDSIVNLNGNLDVTITPTTESSTGFIRITDSARAPGVLQRFLFGFEFSFFLIKFGAEAQFETTTGIAGVSAGFSLVF